MTNTFTVSNVRNNLELPLFSATLDTILLDAGLTPGNKCDPIMIGDMAQNSIYESAGEGGFLVLYNIIDERPTARFISVGTTGSMYHRVKEHINNDGRGYGFIIHTP